MSIRICRDDLEDMLSNLRIYEHQTISVLLDALDDLLAGGYGDMAGDDPTPPTRIEATSSFRHAWITRRYFPGFPAPGNRPTGLWVYGKGEK